jgi:hypothetical protein
LVVLRPVWPVTLQGLIVDQILLTDRSLNSPSDIETFKSLSSRRSTIHWLPVQRIVVVQFMEFSVAAVAAFAATQRQPASLR